MPDQLIGFFSDPSISIEEFPYQLVGLRFDPDTDTITRSLDDYDEGYTLGNDITAFVIPD